jgi:hypothetical protein
VVLLGDCGVTKKSCSIAFMESGVGGHQGEVHQLFFVVVVSGQLGGSPVGEGCCCFLGGKLGGNSSSVWGERGAFPTPPSLINP